MVEISAGEAADRLRTSRQWVTDMLRRGQLSGRQLSSRAWVVDEASIHAHQRSSSPAGRSWSPLASWALLSELAAEPFVDVDSTLRSRVRARIRNNDAEAISRRVASRTTWESFTVDNFDSLTQKLVLTGRSGAAFLSHDLTEELTGAQGYVAASALTAFLDKNWVVPGGDVAIGTYPEGVQFGGRFAPRSVIAADLALSPLTRERSAGLREIEGMRTAWLASHTS